MNLKLMLAVVASSLLHITLQAQSVPIQWRIAANLQYGVDRTEVKKSSSSSGWDAWAKSYNQFEIDLPLTLAYQTDPNRNVNTGVIIGLGIDASNYGYSDVQFGFQVARNRVFFIHNGSNVLNATRSGGEVLELKRVKTPTGWKVDYIINGSVEYTANATDQLYKAYALIRRPGSALINATGAKFVTAVTAASSCDGANGSIELTPNAGLPPYAFSWSDGSTATVRTNLAPGAYNLDMEDALGNQYAHTVYVPAEVEWQTTQNAAFGTNFFINNASPNGVAFGHSKNQLNGGEAGNIAFSPVSMIGDQEIGFGAVGAASGTVKHGFLLSSNYYKWIANGTVQGSSVQIPANARFEVKRKSNGEIEYLVNDAVVGNFSGGINEAYRLHLKVASPQSGVENLSVSFCGIVDPVVVFAEPKPRLDASVFKVMDNVLTFMYKGEYPNHPAEFRIKNELGQVVATPQSATVSNVKSGTTQMLKLSRGYYELDVSTLTAGTYVLEILHPEKETKYLRFKH